MPCIHLQWALYLFIFFLVLGMNQNFWLAVPMQWFFCLKLPAFALILCWLKISNSNFCCFCKSCAILDFCWSSSWQLYHSCIHSVLCSIDIRKDIACASILYIYLILLLEVASLTTYWNCGWESSAVESVLVFNSVYNVVISSFKT